MKKLIITLCFFVISASILAIEPETPPGSGTEKDPYKLSKAEHLLWLSCWERETNIVCVLSADIDARKLEEEGSLYFDAVSLDGQFHELKISSRLCWDFSGMLKDIKLSGGTFCRYFYGDADRLELSNCLLAEEIHYSFITNVKLLNGPLSLSAFNSTFDGILIDGEINNYYYYDEGYHYDGWDCFGGCVGYAYYCTIRNVRSNAMFKKYGIIGGIVGISKGSHISTSFFTGRINGYGLTGGVIGCAEYGDYVDPTMVQDCFFDVTHAAANGYGAGVSPAELRRQETFEHWDFENVWEIEEGFSYPTLRDSNSSGTKTIISQGLSIAGISIKGKLSDEELNEIKENPTICLYSEGVGAEITARQELQESKPFSFSYKSKEEAVSISYSGKSKSLKFSSASPQITLGKSSDEGFSPCKLSDCSMKLTSSMTIIKDISEHLRQNGKLSLYDSEIFGNVLGGTTVELKQKGNNLSYKGANGDVKITCKINLKNKMIQIKYISNNVIQPVILCEKK